MDSLFNITFLRFIRFLGTLRFLSIKTGVWIILSVLKMCCKFTGENPCKSAISIKLWSNLLVLKFISGGFKFSRVSVNYDFAMDFDHSYRITPAPSSFKTWIILFKNPENQISCKNLLLLLNIIIFLVTHMLLLLFFRLELRKILFQHNYPTKINWEYPRHSS